MPYQSFDATAFPIILAIGNDGQFNRFCRFVKITEVG
jgi:hypothetical protein